MTDLKFDDARGKTAPPDRMESLYAAQESALLLYARRLVNQSETAQDLVQEAFMRLYAEFDTVKQPQAWLYRTVHNLALNHLRAQRKLVSLDPPSPRGEGPALDTADPQPLPDEQIARWEVIGLVHLSLETLDDRSRQLVRLKFGEDLSYQEMSTRTGLKIGHVGYLLHHALKSIAAELAKTEITP